MDKDIMNIYTERQKSISINYFSCIITISERLLHMVVENELFF